MEPITTNTTVVTLHIFQLFTRIIPAVAKGVAKANRQIAVL
jgi:hypothetical protein